MPSRPKQRSKVFDEFYVLRLDSSGRPRGARFTKLTYAVASTAIDMNCHTLICQPRAVCVLGMKLPVGRLWGSKLAMPRIRRDLYDQILGTAVVAAGREKVRMKARMAKQTAYIKQLIQQAETALAESRDKEIALATQQPIRTR